MTSEPAEVFTPPAGEAYNTEAPQAEKRRCTSLTRKGDPCKSWALKDDALGRCPAHAGVALKNLNPVKAQRVSAENRKQRSEARKKSALDWAAEKLEENGEELADLVMAAARAGQWKAVEFLYNRIYGRPTEHIVTEPPKARWKQEMDALSLEELEALRARFRTERERETRKAVEPEEERSPRPPLGASKEEVFAWRREQPWYKDNKGKQLRAVQDEPDKEAV